MMAGRIAALSLKGRTRSAWPIPFWTTTTVVSGPASASNHGAVPAVSCAFVVTSSHRTGSTPRGAVAMRTGASRVSPSSSTVSRSNGVRTHSVTSRPAQASCAAK